MEKWHGQVSSTLDRSIKPDQAWSLLGDFSNIHKFFTVVATCRIIEGTNGVLGCVRHCIAVPDPNGAVNWAKEKLLAIDPIERSYSYEMVESNMGFGQYLATLRVVNENEGCAKIEMLFECEPIVGWPQPDFVGFLESAVKEMAKRIEDMLRV